MQNETTGPGAGFVYVQTNEPERNRVLAFRRAGDGTLTPAGGYETGEAGDGKPHLTSQGSVVLTGDGRYLLVTNAASGDLSVFAVGPDGLTLLETVRTGRAPKSAAEHAGLVYVLNTGEPSLAGLPVERGAGPAAGRLGPGACRRHRSGPGRLQPRWRSTGGDPARHERHRRLPGGRDRAARPAAGAAVARADAVWLRLHRKRRARRDRGLRRPGREGRRLLVPDHRRWRGSHLTLGRQRPQRDLLGGGHQRRPLRLHHQLRRRSRFALLDRRRRQHRARRGHGRARGRWANRSSRRGSQPGTAGSCTRSTPTTSACSAGPSARAGHYHRPGRGRGCPLPWPASRPAEATRLELLPPNGVGGSGGGTDPCRRRPRTTPRP